MPSEFKECPKCGATMGDWVGRCECGHVFGTQGKASGAQNKTKRRTPESKGVASRVRTWLPWIVFAGVAAWSCNEESEIDKLRRRVSDLEASCLDDSDVCDAVQKCRH
jgi:hypothetical protein